MDRQSKIVLPLIGSPFEPGEAKATVNSIMDGELQNIAWAEFYYFSGKAENCTEIAKQYIESEQMVVRLSASLLYCFSSLTLGNAAGARKGVESIRNCLNAAFKEGWDEEIKAVCVFSAYLSTVLLHISPDELPALEDYSKYLPIGLRLYALYILAHKAYLKCDYGRALGMHSLR